MPFPETNVGFLSVTSIVFMNRHVLAKIMLDCKVQGTNSPLLGNVSRGNNVK